MFRSVNRSFLASLTSRLAGKPARLAVGSLALVAVAAPMMAAGPWDGRGYWNRRPVQKEIIIREEHRAYPIAMPVVEVEPYSVQFTAYQTGDTVMIFANGANRTGGYATSLGAIDTRGSSVTLKLCNIAPQGCATEAITPFSINAAIHADCALSTIDIRLGNRVVCVPVQRVARIS